MRPHHWLFLIGIVLILAGFAALAVAVAILKFIFWGIGMLIIIAAISALRRRPR